MERVLAVGWLFGVRLEGEKAQDASEGKPEQERAT
jgi:hypothetical protein